MTTDVRIGEAPSLIVSAARAIGARLILLGTAEPDVLHRLCGADTAARVVRAADVPVMVVPRGCAHLPESALIAVDFSDVSVAAGRAALTLFPDVDVVHLVHVAPPPQPALELFASSERRHVETAEEAFNAVRDALPLSACMVVGREVARGSPARELLRVARERRVDLIVAGSHGRGAFQRLLVGSVATTLLRAARVPVLILPARAASGDPAARTQAASVPSRYVLTSRRVASVGETLTDR
jgi:nucleotide-binding universal stress UspA family protein